MIDSVRESVAGLVVRALSNHKILAHPEEHADFFCPPSFYRPDISKEPPSSESLETNTPSLNASTLNELIPSIETGIELFPRDRMVIVGWYSAVDQANPQNWSNLKKCLILLQLCLYTFAVYVGSAIVTPAQPLLMERYGVSQSTASLVLSMYVLGYGIGPLLFSPLSEIPSLGRNLPYMSTFGLFVIMCIPTALVDNFAGLVVLRFLQGFLGSPVLATAGASMGDMFSMLNISYALTFWVSAAYCGPALGPLLSAFAVQAENWRWAIWEIMWIAGPVFLCMVFFMPETNPDTILLQRAQRLRKATGKSVFQAESEIKQKNMKFSRVVIASLEVPFLINMLDPAMLFANVYTSLTYGIYYSFFDIFPVVYIGVYHYSQGIMGVIFLCIIIACILAIASYCAYLYFYMVPWNLKNGIGSPEKRLVPALYAATLPAIGLFLFGWTARANIPWPVPTIGIVLYGGSNFVVAQCIFVYIALTYPKYSASLFASNDFMRSALAAGAIHFAQPLFANLGIGKGCSLLGGLMVLMLFGIWALWYFGAALRRKSRFASAW